MFRRIRPAQRKRAAEEGLEGSNAVKRLPEDNIVSSPSPSESPNMDPRTSAYASGSSSQSYVSGCAIILSNIEICYQVLSLNPFCSLHWGSSSASNSSLVFIGCLVLFHLLRSFGIIGFLPLVFHSQINSSTLPHDYHWVSHE